ncbi:hypothetical protein GCM10008917_27730 [Paraclostridium tenue]|uniref:Transposase n=1 Tax=Paraclostridium tenue TaxID=1737 RepID=A0ABN1MAS5_9FIRM
MYKFKCLFEFFRLGKIHIKNSIARNGQYQIIYMFIIVLGAIKIKFKQIILDCMKIATIY